MTKGETIGRRNNESIAARQELKYAVINSAHYWGTDANYAFFIGKTVRVKLKNPKENPKDRALEEISGLANLTELARKVYGREVDIDEIEIACKGQDEEVLIRVSPPDSPSEEELLIREKRVVVGYDGISGSKLDEKVGRLEKQTEAIISPDKNFIFVNEILISPLDNGSMVWNVKGYPLDKWSRESGNERLLEQESITKTLKSEIISKLSLIARMPQWKEEDTTSKK